LNPRLLYSMASRDAASNIRQALVTGGKVSAGDVARLAAAVVTVAPTELLNMKWSATRATLGRAVQGDRQLTLG